jgi:ABC-type branched-subunit amino acid transport system permease subunit
MFAILGISPQQLFQQLLVGLINGSFYALLSLGLSVIFGMLNIVNFAHGALYMVGASIIGSRSSCRLSSSAHSAHSSNGRCSGGWPGSIRSIACC